MTGSPTLRSVASLRRWKRLSLLGVGLLSAVASLLLSATLVRRAGTWLVVEDPVPPHLDAIFTFSGEGIRTHYTEVALLPLFPRATWFLGQSGHAFLARPSAGSRPGARTFLTDASSTREEVCLLRAWIERQPTDERPRPLDIGLVSGPYHMRRVATLAREILGHPEGSESLDVRLHLLPVPQDSYPLGARDYRHWWRERHLRRLVPREIRNVLGERLLGRRCPESGGLREWSAPDTEPDATDPGTRRPSEAPMPRLP